MRIGQSWDIHRLIEGRKLMLGGIEIPYHRGLLGHSDADVVLHVVAEAILGALALGDLGTHFPDTDNKWAGVDSSLIVSKVYAMAIKKNYIVGNIDITIYAEEPKMNPHILNMQNSVAKLLNLKPDCVSIKATTYEKLDAIGNGQAIAASAIVLMKESL